MLTDLNAWLRRFEAALRALFPGRVRFLGLQGSRSRGEETPDSDIDVVVVLDRLDAEDIRRYRAMLDTLPERALICGFLGGWDELTRWEPSDLFQLCHDTTPISGSLDALLAAIAPEDVDRAVRIGACNIYHGCVHTMCHGRSAEHLRDLYKAACFTLQALHFRRTGTYLRRRAELLPLLTGPDALVLETAMRLRAGEPVDFEPMAELLFRWAQGVIALRWNTVETAHFTLRYDDRDRALAETLRLSADGTFDRVARDMGVQPAGKKYDFYLCPDVAAYMEVTGYTAETYETWMVGWASDTQRRLCILSPRVVKDRPPEAMDKVIIHEIVHIVMDTLRPGDECPLWLGEGVATLYAGQVNAMSVEACPSIRELEEDFVGNGGYDYAGAYVWYAIQKAGMERFKRLYAGEEDVGQLLAPGFEREAVAAWQRHCQSGGSGDSAP